MAKQVEAGDGFSVVLAEDGTVYTFGKGNCSRTGHGSVGAIYHPTRVETLQRKFKARIKEIAVGGRHVLAVSEPVYDVDNVL